MHTLSAEDQRKVADLKRCLKNARGRAAYWSGNPSCRAYGFDPKSPRAAVQGHAIEYETAMSDIDVLCAELERLTGRTYKRSDPKAEFRARFANIFRPHPGDE